MKTKEDKRLIHFYKQVALMIIKSKDKRVSLISLEAKFQKHAEMVFSWMQWNDAKVWFHRGIYACGIAYTLRPEYANLSAGEMIAKMNEYYGLYQD